ncbi:hypothetical protein [Demequina sediminicola]|uniref:hypothetical protein n=1 Tax=Demequina sediminicola TaxID=1095026 RepID=UPI000AEB9475|nr:hypothetical protein [Demequina sediminicola]
MGLDNLAGRAAAVTTAIFILAGCTGDIENPADASPTASATTSPTTVAPGDASPSPSATALTADEVAALLPDSTSPQDFPSADAFASYFLDNYQALAREQPELFAALSSPNCKFCASVMAGYEQARADQVTIAGGDLVILSAHGYGGIQEDGTFGIEYDFETTPLIETDADGTVTREVAESSGVASIIVRYEDHWVVEEVGSEQSGS